MTNPTIARVAALTSTPIQELKTLWRELFDQDAPPFNRKFLEVRLAYRIQELAYGGLRPETAKRLERLGEDLDGGQPELRRRRADDRPVAGTRLIRYWQGVPREVIVGLDYFEYDGRRYRSLSGIARAITGTHRNGWTFFGFASSRGMR